MVIGSILGYSIAGLVVGTAVGATGVGGGSLMTPILILFYGISPTIAVGTDLIYASISKTYGTWLHNNNRSVDWRIVGWMALGSVPAALLTLWGMSHMSNPKAIDQLIKIVLSAAIITTALFTLFQDRLLTIMRGSNNIAPSTPSTTAETDPFTSRQKLLTLISGLLIGSIVTISSVGAGAIGMVILLLLFPRHRPVSLVGSDLAHAVLITAIAGVGHARMGTVDYGMLVGLLIGALPGIYVGSKVGFKLQPMVMKRAIASLLVVVGSITLYKAIPASAFNAQAATVAAPTAASAATPTAAAATPAAAAHTATEETAQK
jgi:uncharacterized membrane protein YfcA